MFFKSDDEETKKKEKKIEPNHGGQAMT